MRRVRFLLPVLLVAALSGCQPGSHPPEESDSEAMQRTVVQQAPGGLFDVRAIPMRGANQFSLTPRDLWAWDPAGCSLKVWGGGEDRLDMLLRGEPSFVISSTPHLLMCYLTNRDNQGRESNAAIAVEFHWKAVAAGRPDQTGITRIEFVVDRKEYLQLGRVYDPAMEPR